MILRTRGVNYERRLHAVGGSGSVEFGSSAIPNFGGGMLSQAGSFVTEASALGLPAVASAVRLVAETLASMPLDVFTGRKGEKRLANDSWQAQLLRRPNEDITSFDFISDVAASVECTGNAFILKVKGARGRLVALEVLDPAWMTVFVDPTTGEKTFRYALVRPQLNLTAVDLIHVRGFTVGGYGKIGLSPIALHRHALGEQIALNDYVGRFYAQGMTPGGAIEVPGDLDPKQVDKIADLWARRHQGASNWHRPAILVNGAKWVDTALSLADAQFIDTRANSVLDVARIWGIPASFLEAAKADRPTRGSTEEELHRLHLRLLPRLRRIEEAFLHDEDFFPSNDPEYPEFDASALLRTDAATQAQIRVQEIQTGQRAPDELRAEDGLPPWHEVNPALPEGWGMYPQFTPVGGAVNPSPQGVPGTDITSEEETNSAGSPDRD